MITLPSDPQPAMVQPRLLDFGILQRPSTGGPATYIQRGGMRFAVDVTYPPIAADQARVFLSRILRGKTEGLRIQFPLSGVSQGSPGSPTVNGTSSTGTNLRVKGLTPGYQALEGYWLSVFDSSGNSYLHNVSANVTASIAGTADISVWPPLRASFADGNLINLQSPVIEGIVPDAPSWPLPSEHTVVLAFSVEEAA